MPAFATRWAPRALVAFCLLAGSAAIAGEVAEVGIRDYRYDPPTIRVKVGASVRWTNNEKRVSHSILFLGPAGFESERIFPGEQFERKFDQPGAYPYTCGPHPEMRGLVEVE